ncbi:HD domain-containing phosphohydrolase [Deefgea rivuli]|uniref:HD domain-containing phosphohydrolase n=1 Tax=Deefgea rivuli TaxID=400948 RepID=UPI000488C71C|nr:HD domain-containing phosphohydrolase [Deefgea rivuli]
MMDIAELHERLEKLNSIGIALSGETQIDRLLESILVAASDLVQADAGTLYLIRDQQLHFEIVINTSLGIAMGGTSGVPISLPSIPLHNADGLPNLANVVACAVNKNKTINIVDAYATDDEYDFSGTRCFDLATGYHSQSFLSVPMRNHEGEVIGALQLINAQTDLREIIPFSMSDQHLVESLASQAAIAITNRILINSLQQLFEGFINLINLAIDDKSPYTGGHCQRVPELTMMLAEAVSRTTEGSLASFSLSERDRYELKIAGLLHDCGKITTPVHVVDKATKLQTIFDRIHLIDTRFEVLLRDIEIAHLRGEMSAEQYQEQLNALNSDREFIQKANLGSEMMSEADINRVTQIAARPWTTAGGVSQPFLTMDEYENLAIRKGTLTAAERQIINHHIEVTIQMLEALPWPTHLLNVPEYAGGHHERMDGKGYPKGLRREEMSVQARIMGIADVFEALTARDRPYKDGMKLSVALGILTRMACEQHVDKDLLEVFLREKVWLDYAKLFLEPTQCDEVDLDALIHKLKDI